MRHFSTISSLKSQPFHRFPPFSPLRIFSGFRSMIIPEEPYLGFAALCHIAGAFCLIPALLHTRTPQGTIAWLISLLAFPYIAVPFYLILGRRRFSGYVETRRRQTDPESSWGELTDKITNCMTPYAVQAADAPGKIMHTLSDIVRLPVCRGNSCRLLIDADHAFPRIYDAIMNAEHYILIEFFIIKNDSVGQNLKDLLIERARAGIRIYMLYDEIGSHKLPPGYISALRKEGVNIEPFNGKRHFLSNILRLNFRNHRKLVVVDGATAFIGGMNIGREYLGKGALGYWRDTFVQLEGPSVQQTQISFLEDWNWAMLKSGPSSLPCLCWEITPQREDETVLMLPSGPADVIPAWKTAIIALANRARERLWIATPYFVPDEGVMAALQAAALRNVDVRILRPERADHILVKLSSFTFLRDLDTYGIQVWAYQKGFLHQKVILMDDDIATVGTANLDNRSLALNFEITAVIHSPAVCAEVKEMLEKDFASSKKESLEDYNNKSLGFKMLCNLARLMAPVQ